MAESETDAQTGDRLQDGSLVESDVLLFFNVTGFFVPGVHSRRWVGTMPISRCTSSAVTSSATRT
jgi:hypothetical protein